MDLIRSIQKRDSQINPSMFEVIFAYPGFHAVIWHRLCHAIWRVELKAIARILSNIGRILTGIEIHPGAQIGERLFIDHGTGTVIGETAIVGNDVSMYHGVTLGGKGGEEPGKRHPTIEDEAIVGAGAQVLGDVTIGRGAKIAAHAVVVSDVPAWCTVVGNPARLVKCEGDDSKAYGLPRELRDPVSDAIDGLLADVKMLKEELAKQKDGKKKTTKKSKDEDYADKWMGSGI